MRGIDLFFVISTDLAKMDVLGYVWDAFLVISRVILAPG